MAVYPTYHVFVDGSARHNIYVLVPKANRRKDWEDKAMVGYYIGYSKTKVGYRVLLGDTVVLFDESIRERSADYFREQDEPREV